MTLLPDGLVSSGEKTVVSGHPLLGIQLNKSEICARMKLGKKDRGSDLRHEGYGSADDSPVCSEGCPLIDDKEK